MNDLQSAAQASTAAPTDRPLRPINITKLSAGALMLVVHETRLMFSPSDTSPPTPQPFGRPVMVPFDGNRIAGQLGKHLAMMVRNGQIDIQPRDCLPSLGDWTDGKALTEQRRDGAVSSPSEKKGDQFAALAKELAEQREESARQRAEIDALRAASKPAKA